MNNRQVRIFRFVLPEKEGVHHIRAPHIVSVLGVQMQDAQPVLWAKVYAMSLMRTYVIIACPTGGVLENDTSYLGSAQLCNDTRKTLHYFGGGPGL